MQLRIHLCYDEQMSENGFFKNIFKSSEQSPEKVENLRRARIEVESIKDLRGMPVDQKIKETVAIFRAMEIPIDSSCGGHTNEPNDKGYGFPYIRVYSAPPKGWNDNPQDAALGNEWRDVNEKYRKIMTPLLNAFNEGRVNKGSKLYMHNIGGFGAFTIQSVWAETSNDVKIEKEIVERIKACQKEMADFTEYLKKHFLNKK